MDLESLGLSIDGELTSQPGLPCLLYWRIRRLSRPTWNHGIQKLRTSLALTSSPRPLFSLLGFIMICIQRCFCIFELSTSSELRIWPQLSWSPTLVRAAERLILKWPYRQPTQFLAAYDVGPPSARSNNSRFSVTVWADLWYIFFFIIRALIGFYFTRRLTHLLHGHVGTLWNVGVTGTGIYSSGLQFS